MVGIVWSSGKKDERGVGRDGDTYSLVQMASDPSYSPEIGGMALGVGISHTSPVGARRPVGYALKPRVEYGTRV